MGSPTTPDSAHGHAYQVLLDPAKIYGYHLTVSVMTALGANNSMPAVDSIRKRPILLCAALACA